MKDILRAGNQQQTGSESDNEQSRLKRYLQPSSIPSKKGIINNNNNTPIHTK